MMLARFRLIAMMPLYFSASIFTNMFISIRMRVDYRRAFAAATLRYSVFFSPLRHATTMPRRCCRAAAFR